MELNQVHKVHMVGIGGIGMSALARFLHLRGKTVTGYDRTSTPLTSALQAEGINVYFEANPAKVKGADLMIYTPAVPASFPEFQTAEALGVPMMKRAEVLGMISRAYKTVAIAGTHGKTSTTGLTTYLLRECGVDCTGFIGGITNNYNTNFVNGESEWMVVEADEFDRSFLHLSPNIAVITSMDADHLDIYGEPAALQESFRDFGDRLDEGGTLFMHHDLEPLPLENGPKIFGYGVGGGRFRSDNLRHRGLGVTFDFHGPTGTFRDLHLNLPGKYNVDNATAAVAIAMALGCSETDIRNGLDTFSGIKRRFDIRYRSEQVVHIDDYAHHPSEIAAVVSAVRDMLPGYKLIAAFQPHLYSRTRDFHEGFAEELSRADAVVLLDIYPAREAPMEGVSSDMIYARIDVGEKARTDLEGLVDTLKQFKTRPVVVLTIGAGNIDTQVAATQQLVSTW
ncbi:MAG: UDP-N-acetylmuramate--L-alanine ligase [Bacteroidota bacterium]